jgi:hypothetical protein
MNLSDLLSHVRVRLLTDHISEYQWSDAEITRYLNEAQRLFALRTHCFIDTESDFTELTTEIGQPNYSLDVRVISVLGVVDDQYRELRPFVGTSRIRASYNGKPVYWVQRPNNKRLLLWPTPDAVYSFYMSVARYPLAEMEIDSDEPEIPEIYHFNLTDWAAYRCLMFADAEYAGVFMEAAEAYRVAWERNLVQAKRDVYHQATVTDRPSIYLRNF